MYLEQLKRARKLPKTGDIFVFKAKKKIFGFARLIKEYVNIGNINDVFLIYVYNAFSTSAEEVPRLDKRRLLIPPIGVDRSPWTMGLLQTVKSELLDQSDVLSRHCFWDEWDRCYRDEYGNKLPQRTRPCGNWTMSNYAALDVSIAVALGIKSE